MVFMGKHKLQEGMTQADAEEGWVKYKAAAQKKGLKPLHANLSVEKGFAYCETEAPSAQAVRDAHSEAEIPLEDVIEVVTLE